MRVTQGKNLFRPSLITSALLTYLLTYSPFTLAETLEKNTALDEINVQAEQDELSVREKKVGETLKSARQLKRQQVQDSRDLVRYETGISVVETGRFGASGYAVRGVEENRVASTVDGLHQAETLSSQGFKELFEGYGNFNNTRNGVEIETLKQVAINKGANSVKTGSGALGGAVMFETKDARDLLVDKDWHISYKKGYNSADDQYLDSFTLAGRYKWFDGLVVKTKRDGHELENYGYKHYNPLLQGKAREKADPYEIEKDSTLMKLSFSPSENHRFTVAYDDFKNKSNGHDFSYVLNDGSEINFDTQSLRHTKDESKRRNVAFSYENYVQTPFWDSLKISYSDQKIINRARTEDYCDGNDCKTIANPLGLDVKDGKFVDKNGAPVLLKLHEVDKVASWGAYKVKEQIVTDKDGVPFEHGDAFNAKRLREFWFDCSIFNCEQPISVYKYAYSSNEPVKTEVNLTKKYEANGKIFATNPDNLYGSERTWVIIPNSPGYLKTFWRERDLNTNLKQLNLDLNKQFNLFNIENNLEYGGVYSKSHKEMVNKEGYYGRNPQWWSPAFLGVKDDGSMITCEDVSYNPWTLCPKTEPVFSFLVPVDAKNGAVYLNNNMRINDALSFELGYRYDRTKYQPHYVVGVTPKIPSDMVAGLAKNFEPPYKKQDVVDIGEQPKWWSDAYNSSSDPKYLADLSEWNKKNNERKAIIEENKLVDEKNRLARHQANIDAFAQPKKYSATSYSLMSNIDPLDYFRIQLKYAKGFRAPTSDEIYFTFVHPDFTILPNLDLKKETSKTQEVAFTLHNEMGFISTSLFRTKYNDFLDLAFVGLKDIKNEYGGEATARDVPIYQNRNMQNAKVTGIEISSKFHVGYVFKALEGLNLSYKFTYQKGKINGNLPINAIQPKTAIYGIGYDHKSGKFGLDLLVTYVGSKKASDTYNMFWEAQKSKEEEANIPEKDRIIKDSSVRWRSNAYTLIDVIAYVKPIKNLTLQAGVYNLTNEKYVSWDSARSIRAFGTSNMIDQRTGNGFNRFNAPGRNFKLSAELTF